MDVPQIGPIMGLFAGLAWRGFETWSQISFRNQVLVATDWARTKLFGRDTSRVCGGVPPARHPPPPPSLLLQTPPLPTRPRTGAAPAFHSHALRASYYCRTSPPPC